MTVTNKPDHRGEHEVSRKPSRAGMPGLTGEPVVTTLVCFLLCTRGCGCIGARHSPRPLISGRKIQAHLGRIAPRECGNTSLRAKRSNPFFLACCSMDCFASLAMTAERARYVLTRHHPRRRAIQYPQTPEINRRAAAYWIVPASPATRTGRGAAPALPNSHPPS